MVADGIAKESEAPSEKYVDFAIQSFHTTIF
jgi:hypothetical protein